MDLVRRYVRYLQLTHPTEEAIINKFELASIKKELLDKAPVVYLYSDGMGVLRFRNIIYGAEEDGEPSVVGAGETEVIVLEMDGLEEVSDSRVSMRISEPEEDEVMEEPE